MFPILDTTWIKSWQPEFVGTLMFVVKDRRVLLIHKKTGHGAGKINGPGGKIHSGESVLDCAIRETQEEVGITPLEPKCVLEMRFVEENGPQWLGFACIASDHIGEHSETEEAKPFWCDFDDIPYTQMWPDDAVWLPRIMEGEITTPLVADFLFRNGELLDHQWINVESVIDAFG